MTVPAPIHARPAEPLAASRLFLGERSAPGRAAAAEVAAPGDAAAADQTLDPIDAWLAVLASLLDLPARERDSIRDELREHLRERVRDLVLAGRAEHDAVSAAMGELGDAAALARRFREATHAPRRRLLMHTALFGLAGAAMITSVVALRGGGSTAPMSVFQPPQVKAEGEAPRVSVSADSTWEDFFARAGKAAGKPVHVHWNHLRTIEGPEGPLDTGTFIGVEAANFPLPRALEIINDQMNLSPDEGVDFRVIDGRLEFATVAYFDQRETTLVTFDLAPVIEARRAVEEDVSVSEVVESAASVIHDVVHPEMWADNGGDRAMLTMFDTRLFIKAPRRIMPEVEWVIGEMSKGGAVAAASAQRPVVVIDTPGTR